MSVLYHPEKANFVVNALTRVSMGSTIHVANERKQLVKDVHQLARFGVRLSDSHLCGIFMHNEVKLSLQEKVKATQDMDLTSVEFKKLVVDTKVEFFS